MTASTTTNKFFQIVDIKDFRYEQDCSNIDYGELASDCESKTISIIDAIQYISQSIYTQTEDNQIENDKIRHLSGIIYNLTEIAIATNKVSQVASYLSGIKDGNNGA